MTLHGVSRIVRRLVARGQLTTIQEGGVNYLSLTEPGDEENTIFDATQQ